MQRLQLTKHWYIPWSPKIVGSLSDFDISICDLLFEINGFKMLYDPRFEIWCVKRNNYVTRCIRQYQLLNQECQLLTQTCDLINYM